MEHRGMRDVPTMQAIYGQNQKRSREQFVTNFARLEHEKARLERELQLWTKKKESTEELLNKVLEELEIAQQSLMLVQSSNPPPRAKGRRGRSKDTARTESPPGDGTDSGERSRWREMEIEY